MSHKKFSEIEKKCELEFVYNQLKNLVFKNEKKISVTFWDSAFLNLAQKFELLAKKIEISRISKILFSETF